MTTIKLSKKPINTPSTGKAPVRRADPAKRDRTKAPPKPMARTERAEEGQASTKGKMDGRTSKLQPEASFSRVGANNERSERPARTGEAKPAPARQRNHRHDGSLREESQARPVRSQENAETKPASTPNPNRNVDTRITPRANRDEPQYRQAPRRGGKARDGYDPNAPTYGAAAKAA